MQNSKTLRRLFLLTTIIVLSSVLAAGIYTRASRFQQKERGNARTYQPAKVTEAPEVKSKVDGLEIAGVTLINQGTPAASIAIDVINNRDEAVMALDFVSSKNGYSGGISMDGLLEESSPRALIPPHSLETFTWGLGAIFEGTTGYLAAAIFADGKEEGDKQSLHGIKIHRFQNQQRRREEKAKNGGQQ